MRTLTCHFSSRTKARRLAMRLLVLWQCFALIVQSGVAMANPLNGSVVAGQAGITQSGSTLTINQTTDRAIGFVFSISLPLQILFI